MSGVRDRSRWRGGDGGGEGGGSGDVWAASGTHAMVGPKWVWYGMVWYGMARACGLWVCGCVGAGVSRGTMELVEAVMCWRVLGVLQWANAALLEDSSESLGARQTNRCQLP